MKWTKRSVMELIAIVVTMAVVFILAIFQYRWTGEISRVEQVRLEAALDTSVRNFNQEFSYDFERLCESFEVDPEAPASTLEARVLRQYLNWIKSTSPPDFLAGLYIWRTGDTRATFLESLDLENQRFQEMAWPTELRSLQQFLGQQTARLLSTRSDREAVYYPWTFFEDTPALFRPLFQMSSDERDSDSKVQPIGFLIVELSGSFLRRKYLPGLVDRHFGQLDFGVAVRSARPPYQAIYLSNANFPISTSSPDAELNLFDSVGEEARRRGHPTVQPSSESRQWQLVAQHPSGSLEAAVAAFRRRNLAISLGLLSILAGSVALVLSVARRAERFGKVQMEFVAGVSHELCTPLAVINSAVENLADGVVDNPGQIQEYAGILRDQGGRLERLLDQVLLFAAGRFDRSEYDLAPVDVATIVAQSMTVSERMLRDAGFSVEQEISADLPLVTADPAAVIKCMENLISNAMKYASSSRWIAVRARAAPSKSHGEVQISVEDKGIGIPAAELPNIFKPFYRVHTVPDGRIRGVGLGLYLVKRMTEGMGGRVSVSSELGRGTCFVLHFPVPDAPERRRGRAAQ
jgi:signal transduction histidine kinase